jgi:probable F420-dependent oxidoreductase
MRFTLEYPSELPCAPDSFLRPEVIRRIALAAEACGFDAVALSEHPAPSVKWRRRGGHDTLDPIAALGFMAGVTSHLRLMTNLYVLPYRNPYLAAKALTSLDLVSGGRLVAGLGAGYLRSEFAALGVDFDRRAELFDEALAALWSIWVDPDTPVSGCGFEAVGPVWVQPPTQRPHPPIWIGGNGSAALRRVVEYGSGWMPIIAPAQSASVMRTAPIRDAREFGCAVARLRNWMDGAGRDPATVDVQVVCPPVDIDDPASLSGVRETLDELAGHGATWALVRAVVTDPAEAIEFIEAFGTTVIRT